MFPIDEMKKFLTIILLIITVASIAVAQRRVTPVERNTNRTMTSEELRQKKKELKAQGMQIVGDSIVSDSAVMASDTLKSKRMAYPRFTSVIVGVNLWDPIMRIAGQSYGGIDFSAELSMWNRFIPTVELGMGWANSMPEDMNFTYKGKMAVYGKLGMNYNFKFNSSPDYVAMLGIRAGYSSFGYDVKDVRINNGYWDQTKTFDILDQHSHALWGELQLAVRVKLFGNLSAGWAFKYHVLFNHKVNENSDPWYIPGYGSRTGAITGGFSLFYTIPLHKKKKATSHTEQTDGNNIVPKSDGGIVRPTEK